MINGLGQRKELKAVKINTTFCFFSILHCWYKSKTKSSSGRWVRLNIKTATEKMMFTLIYLSNNWSSVAAISSDTAWSMSNFTILFHKKAMQKKSEIFKKPNFFGQTLDFLPPRKPGLHLSRVNFFSFEYNKYRSQYYNQ